MTVRERKNEKPNRSGERETPHRISALGVLLRLFRSSGKAGMNGVAIPKTSLNKRIFH
jgi:hypothetical protein